MDKKSLLRRLFVEACTLASAELKGQTDPRQEDVVDKFPPAERESRRKAWAEPVVADTARPGADRPEGGKTWKADSAGNVKEVKVTEHGIARTGLTPTSCCVARSSGAASRSMSPTSDLRAVGTHTLRRTDETADRWDWARYGAHVAPRGRRAMAPRGRVLSGRCACELVWRVAG